MSVSVSWPLQQAIYTRLVAQLAGQGPNGSDVAVYDHVPADPTRVHVRIDGFNAVQRPLKSDKTQHFFFVHVFDRPTGGDDSGRGQKTAKVLRQTIVAALHDWNPSVTGASKIRHEQSTIETDEDGLTQHAFSRFNVHISAS